MIEKTKVACFSGHRKLPQDCTEIRKNLEKAIITLIDQGVVFFGSGGCDWLGSACGDNGFKAEKGLSAHQIGNGSALSAGAAVVEVEWRTKETVL